MNTYTISLSSNSTNFSKIHQEEVLEDATTLTFILSGLNENVLPLYAKIDWGDGTVDSIENELYKNYRDSDITLEILTGKFSSILQNRYHHTYFPSETSLYRNLSAQILLEYVNGDVTWFVCPLKIRTYDYYESINDIKLVNTNILPYANNPKEHQFITAKGGYLLETRSDP